MLTELLVVGLLIYLALQDYFIGIWCTIAAAISLFGMFTTSIQRYFDANESSKLSFIPATPTRIFTGASIPTCCFSNAMGWRVNFVIQIIVCMIRVALVSYIIVYFTKVSFTANSLQPIRDMDLIAVRICQLACIILSTCSLSPFFHLSLKSPWMVNLRAVDDNFRVNQGQGNRNYNGHEVS